MSAACQLHRLLIQWDHTTMTMPSLDHETVSALRILSGCDRASEDTLATQGVSRACLDALVARGVVRTYRSRRDNHRLMSWFVLVERMPGTYLLSPRGHSAL
jgi:hypothetical protein